ncbi:MAG: hypothetical protein GVY36_07375 [Verrucomicrobia bacterium]|jgi:hypothetical protein|nr:hypothetical protein [Verrucomicrobiota bacterium]
MPIDNLEDLRSLMNLHGAKKIFAKELAPNDNSKNQVYFGEDFSALQIIPHHGVLIGLFVNSCEESGIDV